MTRPELIQQLQKFFQPDTLKLFREDETIWKGINIMQCYFDGDASHYYIENLFRIAKTAINASPEERMEAFLVTVGKRR